MSACHRMKSETGSLLSGDMAFCSLPDLSLPPSPRPTSRIHPPAAAAHAACWDEARPVTGTLRCFIPHRPYPPHLPVRCQCCPQPAQDSTPAPMARDQPTSTRLSSNHCVPRLCGGDTPRLPLSANRPLFLQRSSLHIPVPRGPPVALGIPSLARLPILELSSLPCPGLSPGCCSFCCLPWTYSYARLPMFGSSHRKSWLGRKEWRRWSRNPPVYSECSSWRTSTRYDAPFRMLAALTWIMSCLAHAMCHKARYPDLAGCHNRLSDDSPAQPSRGLPHLHLQPVATAILLSRSVAPTLSHDNKTI